MVNHSEDINEACCKEVYDAKVLDRMIITRCCDLE